MQIFGKVRSTNKVEITLLPHSYLWTVSNLFDVYVGTNSPLPFMDVNEHIWFTVNAEEV